MTSLREREGPSNAPNGAVQAIFSDSPIRVKTHVACVSVHVGQSGTRLDRDSAQQRIERAELEWFPIDM